MNRVRSCTSLQVQLGRMLHVLMPQWSCTAVPRAWSVPSVTGRGSCAAFSRLRALCGFVPHLQGEAYGYGCSNGSFQDLGFQLHPNYTLRLTTHTNTLQYTLSRKALYPGLGFRVVVFGA